MEVWSKRKDRKKKISVPLFPGYLFVEASLDNEIKLAILKTSGVVRILGTKENAEPLPVPEAKIMAIQRITDEKVEMFSMQYPKTGEPVRIMDGPFAGIEGTVIKSDLEKELFVISIDMMQRSVAIKVEGFQIAKIWSSFLRWHESTISQQAVEVWNEHHYSAASYGKINSRPAAAELNLKILDILNIMRKIASAESNWITGKNWFGDMYWKDISR